MSYRERAIPGRGGGVSGVRSQARSFALSGGLSDTSVGQTGVWAAPSGSIGTGYTSGETQAQAHIRLYYADTVHLRVGAQVHELCMEAGFGVRPGGIRPRSVLTGREPRWWNMTLRIEIMFADLLEA